MRPYDLVAAGAAITNTTTETTLYGNTIGGGDLGAKGTMDLVLYGDMVHNTTDSLIWRIKWGSATTRIQNESQHPPPQGSSTVPFELRVQLWNLNATGSQVIWATLFYWSAAAVQGTTGIGNFNAQAGLLGGIMGATPSIDTTVNQTFDVTVQWGAASASNSIRRVAARALIGKN